MPSWPQSRPVSAVSPAKSSHLRSVFSRSDIDISAMKISKQDLRLLEILAMRLSDAERRRSKREKMREEWERERIQRERNKNITEKEYIKYLKIKRCRNEE